MSITYLSHTADIRMLIEAETLQDLFGLAILILIYRLVID